MSQLGLAQSAKNLKESTQSLLLLTTLLCARKLIELDSDRPSPAKVAAVENAISQAALILGHIEKRWPKE